MEKENKQARKRKESIQKILHHSLKLFAAYGYQKTSMKMIATHANISQGLAYNYFKSKSKILHEIFKQRMGDVGQSFEEADQESLPFKKLETLIRSAFRIVRDNMDFWKLTYSLRMQVSVVKELEEDIASWTYFILEKLESILRELKFDDPTTEARLLFAQIDGIAQHYSMDPKSYPLEEVTLALLTLYHSKQG